MKPMEHSHASDARFMTHPETHPSPRYPQGQQPLPSLAMIAAGRAVGLWITLRLPLQGKLRIPMNPGDELNDVDNSLGF